MRRFLIAALVMAGLAGCTVQAPSTSAQAPQEPQASKQAPYDFGDVVDRVMPVAERVCRAERPNANCNFQIMIDDSPGVPANAFQTLDRRGRPLIIFTLPLLQDMRNADEVAFVLGHESAHHIEGHIPRQEHTTMTGAVLAGMVVAATGGGPDAVREAQNLGAFAGSRVYSKEYEFEADILGTIISHAAGYDPVRGAAFFERIPDPGNEFLGTHPPNAERQRVVRQTAAQL